MLTLLNVTFDEKYDSSYRVVYGKDEHHILMTDGSYRKITGDEHFMVADKNNIGQKEYLFECQSYDDDSMDVSKLSSLVSTFAGIRNKLDYKVKSGNLSEIEKYTIIATSNLVIGGLTKKYSNIQEGVLKVMGGKVIDYEAKEIFNQGKSEGLSQGVSEGKVYGAVEALRKFHISDDEIEKSIMSDYHLTREKVAIYLSDNSDKYQAKK